ncbi:phage tail assembly chaperone [Burkholderia plantarii]|uniref:XkdW family protein n=1 Tax=Burkholderia plantarii TaxID=41899 RepID=UPI0009F195EC|nr:phage tail assembly chaperone [Burkholderia plantarii]
MIIDVEQAAFILTRKFPQLKRYTDWHTAHPLEQDDVGGWKQRGPAWIPEWKSEEVPQPTPDDLLAWWPDYKDEYEREEAARLVRLERDDLLARADILIVRAEDDEDSGLVAALRIYRKELRSVPEQATFPFIVEWPKLPDASRK